MTALDVRGLCLRAGSRVLLRDLDWQVAVGEFWCVLGRNGAGKSSLLHVLSGLRAADRGDLRIGGQALRQWRPFELARLRGLMPQQAVDSFSCRVGDAVAIGLAPWRLGQEWDDSAQQARVHEALAAVGMAGRADDDLLQLSGGERQRVAFATLLVQNPALMLLDEPTAHQDIAQQRLLMRLMQQLSSRHAVVASCHDLNLAARFATHVLVLGEGFHRAGPAREVMTAETLSEAFGCRLAERDGYFFAA